jgi:hypothetical protein
MRPPWEPGLPQMTERIAQPRPTDRDAPVACSLGADELERRMAEAAAVGRAALVSEERRGGRHLLRFRAGAGTRRALEGIVAAEAACCPFLELELSESGDELLLAIGAPPEGRASAATLAAAFRG